MLATAAIAVLPGMAASVRRDFLRTSPWTPAERAKSRAAVIETASFSNDARARECRALAAIFERTGEEWPEGTICRPFSARLTSGESVVVGCDARAESPHFGGTRLVETEGGWQIPRATIALVLNDWAQSSDDCDSLRGILVRFLDGPRGGEVGSIGRIYLRRTVNQ
jgi:hypothetical protein